MSPVISAGTIHDLPDDMREIFAKNDDLLSTRESLTPLARNERICRVTIPKKEETRQKHLVRIVEDLRAGKRRPCCWPGCPHRNPAAQKWFA
ncbi:MAG: YdeI/OmpD-associated family protein [Candidatus Peribacteria bacterium]|nr:MAG: YdeI/OmpD-associated family protein [Candidatus Peribacteria bacterium]